MNDLVDRVVESVAGRGFFEALPSAAARTPGVMYWLINAYASLGRVAGALYDGDADALGNQLAHARECLHLVETYSTVAPGEDHSYGVAVNAPGLMWQVLKAAEEFGEFADALLGDCAAGEELADWFVTVCCTADRLAASGLAPGFRLADAVRAKIGRDDGRGHLHGARVSVTEQTP